MKLILITFAATCLTVTTSCIFSLWASNYDFETTAIYTAPKSHIKSYIVATGYVPQDADMGDANKAHVDAKIVFDKVPNDTLQIISNGFSILEVHLTKPVKLAIDSSDYYVTLLNYVRLNGGTNVDSLELKEFVNAIHQTGSGPKGTYLEGQTKFITVDTVHSTRTYR